MWLTSVSSCSYSRLNSTCATRFCNAILAHWIGIPIAQGGSNARRTLAGQPYEEESSPRRWRSLSHFLCFRFRHLTFSTLFLVVSPLTRHSSFSAMPPRYPFFSRTRNVKLVSKVWKEAARNVPPFAGTPKRGERAGVPLMAGNNRMIFPFPVLRRRRIS